MKTKSFEAKIILNGNELIRSFTGEGYKDIKYLKYHSSWDWLLPVYKKFVSLDDQQFVNSYKYKIDQSILNVNIEDAFLYLSSAIKEYSNVCKGKV